ncbi:MAG: hypothetical protein ACK559_16060 [bacterium]
MKEIGKILTYLAAVLFCGAILAPGLYWAAHALADAGVLVVLRKYPFQKYFNRRAKSATNIYIFYSKICTAVKITTL